MLQQLEELQTVYNKSFRLVLNLLPFQLCLSRSLLSDIATRICVLNICLMNKTTNTQTTGFLSCFSFMDGLNEDFTYTHIHTH